MITGEITDHIVGMIVAKSLTDLEISFDVICSYEVVDFFVEYCLTDDVTALAKLPLLPKEVQNPDD